MYETLDAINSRWKQISCYQEKNYITNTFYHNWCLIHLMNSRLSLLWIFSHKVALDFTFSALHMFSYGNKFIYMAQIGYTNIQPFLSSSSHRVDLDFTFCALHMFVHGNKFIHIVQAGYTNIQSKTEINGVLSNLILMRRVHRGCPVSMLLYISAAISYL